MAGRGEGWVPGLYYNIILAYLNKGVAFVVLEVRIEMEPEVRIFILRLVSGARAAGARLYS